MRALDLKFFRQTWRLTRDYWYSDEKWHARGLLAVIVALNLGYVYILVLLNEWYNVFYNALQNYDWDGFWHALGEFAVLATIFILIAVYQLYLQQLLEVRWRRWLTEQYLDKWLARRTYYLMQLYNGNATDNPDQRISEDLQMFTNMTLSLSLGLLRAAATLGSFIAILWRLSGTLTLPLVSYHLVLPGYLVWAALAYAIVGTWLTVKVGRPLVGLNYDQQRFEADFRFSLVRLRENSESIALYGGEKQERRNFMARFQNVFANFRRLMVRQKYLTYFTSGYFQIAIIFPFLVAAPRYFSNEIKLGGLIQISSAFGRVQESLSFFVDSYPQLARWRAVVERLNGFEQHMAEVQVQVKKHAGIFVKPQPERAFSVKELQVALPQGDFLLQPINLKLNPGESLLIAGPSGCGKSTLMRAFAGLWPFGKGQINVPQGERVMFLPQRSYMPLGTLREVLLYPRPPQGITDDIIKQTMVLCKLEHLQDDLDRVDDWARILSMGEQQRIAFVRVLLKRPRWLFLDEATSAVDEPTERHLYTLLRERLPDCTVVSVGHRSTLHSFHTFKLSIALGGTWRMFRI